MIKTYILADDQKPTEAQLKEVEEAAKREIQFDEDCPELSPKMMEKFRTAAQERNRRKAAEKLAQFGS